MTAVAALRAQLRRGWLRILLPAWLWGFGIAAFELTGLPWALLHTPGMLFFGLEIMTGWTVIGLFVIAYTTATMGRWPAWRVLAGFVALAPAGALAYELFTHLVFDNRIADLELRAPYGFLLWRLLFYGALFVAGTIAAERVEATRRLLADAGIARQRAEAELDRARLLALRGQIDPALVLDVLAALQRRYRDDAPAGHRLLDRLVAFLRCAMPALRCGASTLHSEVALVRAWAALQRERDPGRAAWRVSAPQRLPDLGFPPLLLLPLLLAQDAAPQAAPHLRITVDADAVRLDVDAAANAAPLDDALLLRLRVGLQAVHGSAWSLAVHDGTHASAGLTLMLPLPSPLTAAASSRDGGVPYATEGDPRWMTTPTTT